MPDGTAESEALAAAERWLALIDRGDAAASWAAAARLFQEAVDEPRWTQSLEAAQRPLGRPVARRIQSMNYATELPGAPDGEYVVLEYETTFEHKRKGAERVVMMKEPDGSWRAAGYYVR
ncbi:MAG TPA: DUF4019 domain-containing protein [Nannocystis sp.]|jgi:hypothetical protein